MRGSSESRSGADANSRSVPNVGRCFAPSERLLPMAWPLEKPEVAAQVQREQSQAWRLRLGQPPPQDVSSSSQVAELQWRGPPAGTSAPIVPIELCRGWPREL